jgi:hypothetical protein
MPYNGNLLYFIGLTDMVETVGGFAKKYKYERIG